MRYVLLPLLAAISTNLASAEMKMCSVTPMEEIYIDPAEEKCLITMIWGEARGESPEGMAAVAHTALNRAAKSPKSGVCGVVLAPKQYSIFNNNPGLRAVALTNNLEPKHKNPIDQVSWKTASEVAKLVMSGIMTDSTNGSTFYLAPAVMKQKGYAYPRWALEYKMVNVIGNHHFYKPVDKKGKPA